MYLFRPRPFPQYYHLGFDDPSMNDFNIEPAEINIYQIDLPSITSLAKPIEYDNILNPDLSKKDLKEIENNQDAPFIVVNPFFLDGENKLCIMDKIMVASTLKKDGKK